MSASEAPVLRPTPPPPPVASHDPSSHSTRALGWLVPSLPRDGWLLLSARLLRLFSFGWVSVALALYLTRLGYGGFAIGSLFAVILAGDLLVTLYLSSTADSIGRRSVLLLSASLQALAGGVCAAHGGWLLTALVGALGVLSPTGGEVGPFASVEQSSLADVARVDQVTMVAGHYQTLGFVGQAIGALLAGVTIEAMQRQHGWSAIASLRLAIAAYAVFGMMLAVIYLCLSSNIEPLHPRETDARAMWSSKFTLHRPESRRAVLRLAGVLSLDAFASGFVMQSLLVLWFWRAFPQMRIDEIGAMMMGANLLAGVSALSAAPLVARAGVSRVLLLLHVPANILLILIPFARSPTAAIAMLLLRFASAHMDAPARASLVAASFSAEERASAGAILSLCRSAALCLAPLLAGWMFAASNEDSWRFAAPLFVAGGLKLLYDFALVQQHRAATTAAAASSNVQHSYAQVGVSSASSLASQPQLDTNLYDEEADDTLH